MHYAIYNKEIGLLNIVLKKEKKNFPSLSIMIKFESHAFQDTMKAYFCYRHVLI